MNTFVVHVYYIGPGIYYWWALLEMGRVVVKCWYAILPVVEYYIVSTLQGLSAVVVDEYHCFSGWTKPVLERTEDYETRVLTVWLIDIEYSILLQFLLLMISCRH